MAESPFDTLESASEFVRLLNEQVLTAEAEVLEDIDVATEEGAARRVDALRLVTYKLRQLSDHLGAGSRILGDLRALRRLLTRVEQEADVQGVGDAVGLNHSA